MNMKLRLFAAAAGCALLLASCGTSGTDGNYVAMDEFDYGATLTIDKSREIAEQYDKRFVTEGMADAVHQYYFSVQQKDAAMFTDIQLPLYRDYYLGTLLEGKYTDEEIVSSTYDALSDYNGGDFVFSLIDITGFQSLMQEKESDALLQMLDDLASDQGQEAVSPRVTDYCELTCTRYLTGKNSGVRDVTDKILLDEQLFLLQIDGEWKIIYS